MNLARVGKGINAENPQRGNLISEYVT